MEVMKRVSDLYKNRSGHQDGARGDGNSKGPPSHLHLEMLRRLMLPTVSLLLLLACSPAEAWYKQVAGPSYYSVGRASGLLSGIRRSPYTRRAEPEPTDGESAANSAAEASLQNFILRTMVSAPQRNYGVALITITSSAVANLHQTVPLMCRYIISLHVLLLLFQPVCVKDVHPNPQSCQLLQDLSGLLRCKADVFLSLDRSDCAED